MRSWLYEVVNSTIRAYYDLFIISIIDNDMQWGPYNSSIVLHAIERERDSRISGELIPISQNVMIQYSIKTVCNINRLGEGLNMHLFEKECVATAICVEEKSLCWEHHNSIALAKTIIIITIIIIIVIVIVIVIVVVAIVVVITIVIAREPSCKLCDDVFLARQFGWYDCWSLGIIIPHMMGSMWWYPFVTPTKVLSDGYQATRFKLQTEPLNKSARTEGAGAWSSGWHS